MANFGGTILTQRGSNLLAKALTGTLLQFTKIKLGDGVWSSNINPETLTELVSPRLTLPIQSLEVSGGSAKLRFVLTNNSLTEGFFLREIGIYANDPQLGEILYAVTYASNPDFIPASSITRIELVVDVYTVVGNATNVTAVISDTIVLATRDDIAKHNTSQDAHPNIRSLITDLQNRFETYSRLSVGTSFPASPNHNDLFWNSNELKPYKYDARTKTWSEIDWKTIVKASPEWQAGRLRINSLTGKLEISPDGTNWYECIPAVGSQTVELATVDNTSFSYKYWIAPGQTVIIRNANHVPIAYTPIVEPFFEGRYWHSYAYELWIGLRPSNVAISNGDGQFLAAGNSSVSGNRATSLSIVPILEQAAVAENWGNFVLRIRQNQRWLVNSMGQGYQGYEIMVCNCSGTAPTTSYWLGTWYNKDGANFTVEVLVLTRTA